MKISLTLIIVALIVSMTGCKLDKPDFIHNTFVSPGGNSQSTSYLPAAKGTYWTYRSEGFSADTIKTTLTGASQTINNKIYLVGATVSHAPNENVYFYSKDHIYAFRQTSLQAKITLEFLYLNDTTAVGHSWTAPVTDNGLVNGIPGQIIGTVKEKNITKVVSGKTFSHVIHTQLDLQYDYPTLGFTSSGIYDYYIAQGVGIIEIDSDVLGLTATSKIIDYAIK